MMKKMRFDIECVKEMLVNCGVVFTVRSYCLDDCDVFVDDIGICKRSLIGEVKYVKDLEVCACLSGFDDVRSWVEVIRKMYKGKRKYLYEVEVLAL
jgi:hypothetical protein